MDWVEGITKKRLKPVAMHIVSNPFFVAQLKRDKGFPTFDTVEDAVGALSAQWKYCKFRNRIRSPYPDMEKEKNSFFARSGVNGENLDRSSENDLIFFQCKRHGKIES